MPLVRLDQLQQFTAINLLLDPGAIGGPKIIPQTAEISLVWGTASGKFALNILDGLYSGPYAGTVAQATAIHTALTTGAGWTGLAAHIAPTASLTAVRIRDLNVAGSPILQSTSAPAPGTSSGSELPDEVAVVVTKRTALVGPQNRGRIYVPGWATTALGAGNTVAAAAVTALGAWANLISGALSNQGYVHVIGHPARQAYVGSTGTSHAARPAGTVPVTSVAVRDNHWDSMRRRGLR